MKVIGMIAGWTLAVLFILAALVLLGMGEKLKFLIMAAIALVFLPPLWAFLGAHGVPVRWWARALALAGLWGALVLSFALAPARSIYKSPEYRERIARLYDEKLSSWPTAFENRFVDTEYGRVHVVASGPADGEPVLLINASGLGGWSWIYNVGALNDRYRTYAVDNIGEAGRNDMKRPGFIPGDGPAIAAFYAGICDRLGIERAHVIGASVGGYIATQFALHAPQRVGRLVLLCSMGFGNTLRTIATMMLAQSLPLKPVQDWTLRWAFGSEPRFEENFGPWFRLMMKGTLPTPIRPRTLAPEQLRRLRAPTLAFIGARDRVVGDAARAAAVAGSIPGVRVRVVDSGHLVGFELAGTVNREIMEFLASKD